MMRGVEQRIHLRDAHPLLRLSRLHDLIAGAHLALLEDSEVEPRPPARGEERSHPRLVRANPDAVAGHPRLRHLEERRADPVAIADAHLVIRQPLDGEVLAEPPVGEIAPGEALLPVAIRLDLIDEHRPLLSPVPAQIALPVAFDVEPPYAATTLHRILPVSGVHGPPAPFDTARQPDVNRDQPG